MLLGKGADKGDRSTYISRMRSKLDDWDVEISEMERNSDRLKSSVINDHQEMMDKLDHQMSKGREKMKELIHATDDSWHTVRDSADSLLKDIKVNLEHARKTYHDELEDD